MYVVIIIWFKKLVYICIFVSIWIVELSDYWCVVRVYEFKKDRNIWYWYVNCYFVSVVGYYLRFLVNLKIIYVNYYIFMCFMYYEYCMGWSM